MAISNANGFEQHLFESIDQELQEIRLQPLYRVGGCLPMSGNRRREFLRRLHLIH